MFFRPFSVRNFGYFFLLLLFILFISIYTILVYFPHTALRSSQQKIIYDLPVGASCKRVAQQLTSQDLFTVRQARFFCWWTRYKGMQTKLQSGEYAIPLNITPQALLEKFSKGEVIQHAITIKEGMNIDDVQKMLLLHPSLNKTNLLENAELWSEGEIFPDTYYFTKNTLAQTVVQRARHLMQATLQAKWEKRSPECILKTPYEALILASIIEKETANDRERPIVSGVFQRRLVKNMRLQADPTVVYGIRKNGNRSNILTKENLQQDTPYNTYVHKGLPPTPIALPSLQSIEAALHPDNSEALYFVAKGDGTHHFSITLQEHNKAVMEYQRAKKHE